MATAIQRRRGTSTQHGSFTGLAGEITIDTTNNTVIVHDGSTAGGHRLAKYTEVQSAATGDITGVVAGNGLTGGADSGSATLNIDPSYFDKTAGGTGFQANFEPQANNTYSLGSLTNVWKDVYVGPGSLYVNGQQVLSDSSGTIQISADTNQNISTVTSGTGDIEFTAGGTIQFKSNVVLSSGKVITTEGGAATTFTSNVNMNSNNINNVADPVGAQDAATKAYVDAQVDTADALSELSGDTDDITEGSTNLFYTDARADARVAAASDLVRTTGNQSIAGNKTFSGSTTFSGTLAATGSALTIADNLIELNSGTSGSPSENVGIIVDRGDSTDVQFRWNETNDNWEYSNNGADYFPLINLESLSVTDNGGDGSLSYNNGSGVFSYTGPSASETRAHFSAGTGLSVSSGQFSISNSGVSAGVYGDADSVAQITVNAQGQITDASNVDIAVTSSAISDLESTVEGYFSAVTSGDGSLSYSNGVYTYAGPGDSDYRAAVSVTDAGGDGSLAYNSSTGVITYTGPSASEVRAHFSAGTGVTYSGGAFSIGQAVGTSDDVTFNAVTISGDLTVSGTTTTVNSNTVNIGDSILTLNSDETGTPSENGGIEIERGTATNVSLLWDEGNDRWTVGAYNFVAANFIGNVTGDVSGDVTGQVSDISNHDTGDLTEGSNLYFTNARADARVNAVHADTDDLSEGSTNLYFTNARADARITAALIDEDNMASNSATRLPSQQSVKAYVDSQVASKDALSELTGSTDDVTEGSSNLYYTDARARGAISVSGDLSYNSSTGVISFTNDAGDIESVTAGTGLTGGGTSGAVTLNVVGGTGIVANANDIAIDFSEFDTDSITEGSTNVFHTAERVQDVVGAQLVTNGSHTGISASYDDANDGAIDLTVSLAGFSTSNLSEGSNQYFTNERVDDRVNALLQAGSGISLSYDDAAGTLTITGQVGDITGVTAGTGLTGGGSSGSVTLNVDTGAVANGSTAIPTADAVYDFVIGQGYTTNVGDITAVTAGVGLSGGGSSGGVTLAFDGSELTDMTAAVVGSEDELILLDNGADRRKLISEINLGQFNNDQGWTSNVGDITGVTAGTGLSGGGSSGSVTLNVSGLSVAEFAGSAIQTGAEAFSDSDTVLMTAAAVNDRIQAFGYTTNVGDITGVTAGTGLSGGGSSGSVTLNVDLSELTDMTAAMAGTDEFIVLDAGADRRKAANEIGLSIFSNDAGFTTNVGDITGVVAGSGLTGGATSGSATLNVGAGSYINVAADSISVNAATAATASTVAARDSSGNLTANIFNGTATSARYADLAEKYSGPADLEAGDVVCFGGELEVEACEHEAHHAVAGVISTDPAYMMNSEAEGHYVALTGRVPCKVTGPVAKGDLLVSSSVKGHAKSDNNAQAGRIIGKAVGSSEGGEAVIEVLVNMM